MDKFFDKLGLYDFWGMFFPGFIGMIVFTNVLAYINKKPVIDLSFNDSALFYLVYSYLLGVILHEVGHFLQDKVIYRHSPFPIINRPRNHGEPFDTFLDHADNSFSPEEKKLYYNFFEKWQSKNDIVTCNPHYSVRLFFNYCDFLIEKKGKNTKAAKMQSLYGMSRSLFVFFGLLTFFIYPYSKIISSNVNVWKITLLSCFATVIFGIRMRRFNVIRLKVVLRTFWINK